VTTGAASPSVRADLSAAASLIDVTGGRVTIGGIPIAHPLGPWRARAREQASTAFYTAWFTRTPSPPGDGRFDDGPSIAAQVRAAHAATGRFDERWQAQSVAPGGHVVAAGPDGAALDVGPMDYVNLTRPGAPVRSGDSLAIAFRRDSIDEAGAWWMTWRGSPSPLVRIYWNAGPDVVARLVRGVTSVLEDAGAEYMMKCPTLPALFARADGIVLYLAAGGWPVVRGALRDVHAGLASRLRPDVPPLTLRLGAGVAAAEDPEDGRSFGQSRSDAVAAGALQIIEEGLAEHEDRLACLTDALAASGIDPERPYLRPGSNADALESW
jgi:hypothetical protein